MEPVFGRRNAGLEIIDDAFPAVERLAELLFGRHTRPEIGEGPLPAVECLAELPFGGRHARPEIVDGALPAVERLTERVLRAAQEVGFSLQLDEAGVLGGQALDLARKRSNVCLERADVFIFLGDAGAQIRDAVGQTRGVFLELTAARLFSRQVAGEPLSEGLADRENALRVAVDVLCRVCGSGLAGLIGKASGSRSGGWGRERGEEPPVVHSARPREPRAGVQHRVEPSLVVALAEVGRTNVVQQVEELPVVERRVLHDQQIGRAREP